MPILVGTASWTDKNLIGCGRFYPKEASSAEARLRYYAMPSASNAKLWAERTPATFVFNLKAVHFKFAPWLLCNREGHAHVAHCVQMMQGRTPAVKMAVEFRNRRWPSCACTGATARPGT